MKPAKNRQLHRRLLSGLFWALVGRCASIFSIFFLYMLLARSLSKQEFGVYVLMSASIAFSSLIASMGLTQTVLRVMRESISAGSMTRGLVAARVGFRLTAMHCHTGE